MFTLEFSTENEVFQEISESNEVHRILLAIAARVKKGDRYGICVDLNGNQVGSWQLKTSKQTEVAA